MPERYELDQILSEIEEDKALESEMRKGKVSQDEILKLIQERVKREKEKS